MADVFDYARGLAKALRECEQSRQMRKLAQKVKGSKSEQLLSEFRLRQFELQAAGLQGKAPSKEETERLQRLVKTIEQDATLKEYLMAETAYGQLLIEVQKVLAEPFNPDVPGQVQGKSK